MKEMIPFAKQIMFTQNYHSMGIGRHKSFCQIHILQQNGSHVYKGPLKEYDPILKRLEIRLERTSPGGLGPFVSYGLLMAGRERRALNQRQEGFAG